MVKPYLILQIIFPSEYPLSDFSSQQDHFVDFLLFPHLYQLQQQVLLAFTLQNTLLPICVSAEAMP